MGSFDVSSLKVMLITATNHSLELSYMIPPRCKGCWEVQPQLGRCLAAKTVHLPLHVSLENSQPPVPLASITINLAESKGNKQQLKIFFTSDHKNLAFLTINGLRLKFGEIGILFHSELKKMGLYQDSLLTKWRKKSQNSSIHFHLL